VLAAAGATVTSTGAETLTVTGLEVARIAELAAESRIPVHELTPRRTSLEEAFLDLTRDAVEFSAGTEVRS
jgi:ABC-2 type transport system ATP-binding protein